MKVIEKIKKMPRKKLVSRILLILILIYSLGFTSLFIGLSLSLFTTLESINIPDSYLMISLVPENPSLNTSYRISNKGFSDISDFTVDFKVNLMYFEMYSDNETQKEIFFKSEKVNKIDPWQNYESNIEGSSEFFNETNLYSFWNNVNLSRPFYYILDINITGKYCLGIIPFRINIDNLNPECPTCN